MKFYDQEKKILFLNLLYCEYIVDIMWILCGYIMWILCGYIMWIYYVEYVFFIDENIYIDERLI